MNPDFLDPSLPRKHQVMFYSLLIILLGLTFFLYQYGLPGRFILDDETNLHRLSMLNNSPTFETFKTYIIDGLSSTLGRPLSLLSFAAQHDAWPHKPGAFKLVNIFIHLLNGILILILSLQVLSFAKINPVRSLYLSLLITALWLLHPIQVSTVLYVVQRMTQLSALFMLLGIVCYFYGRSTLITKPDRKLKAYLWMSIGIGAGGILSVLSKENGILLPLYVILIEFTVLQQYQRDRLWKIWGSVFLLLPLALLSIYILISFNGFISEYEHREFNMMERVLTETRVLSHYLYKSFIIQPSAYGLFHDDFRLSTGLLTPVSTLTSVVFIATLLGTAIYFRKKIAILALTIFWFFASHFLESGFIPLEIYFEHRNYLAMFGLMFGLVMLINWLSQKIHSTLILRTTIFASIIWCLLLATTSAKEIYLWGKPLLQAQIWGNEKPWSKRAQATRVNVYALRGEYKAAITTMQNLSDKYPKDAAIYFSLFQLQCLDPRMNSHNFDNIIKRLATSRSSHSAISALAKIIHLKEIKTCKGFSNTKINTVLTTLINNKNFEYQLADIYFLYARYYLLDKNTKESLTYLKLSWKQRPQAAVIMYQIQIHAYLKQNDIALQHVQAAKKYLSNHFKQRLIYQKAINKWEALIIKKLNSSKSATP